MGVLAVQGQYELAALSMNFNGYCHIWWVTTPFRFMLTIDTKRSIEHRCWLGVSIKIILKDAYVSFLFGFSRLATFYSLTSTHTNFKMNVSVLLQKSIFVLFAYDRFFHFESFWKGPLRKWRFAYVFHIKHIMNEHSIWPQHTVIGYATFEKKLLSLPAGLASIFALSLNYVCHLALKNSF
jgi:hypothetical protein